jgi:hypothetical protein
MESHLGNGVGSSRSAKNTKNTSSSVDWLSRDMLEMKIRDKTEADEERDSEPDIIDGVGAEPGHVITTTLPGRNGQSRQTVSYIAEHVVGTGSFGMVFQVSKIVYLVVLPLVKIPKHFMSPCGRLNAEKLGRLLPSKKFYKTSVTRTENYKLCRC